MVDGGFVGGTGFKAEVAGESGNINEWVIDNGKKGIARFTSTTDYVVHFHITWYEESR